MDPYPKKTVTIIAAFSDLWQAVHAERTVSRVAVSAHLRYVELIAKWAAARLEPGTGFTASPSFGAGKGDDGTVWPVECGVTLTFAGVEPARVPAIVRFALELKAREEQQAVAVLVRDEGFELV